MAAPDPEVRELSLAYARAVAVAERLAYELDQTVADLVAHVRSDEASSVDENNTTERKKTASGTYTERRRRA